MKSLTKEIILIFIISLVIILALGFSMGLHSFTIVEWWKPVAVCSLPALAITFLLAGIVRHVTGPLMKYVEYPLAFILSFSTFLLAFYTLNYYKSDPSTAHEYMAPVVRKYSEERTRSRRISRHFYRSEKYTVYFIELEMSDGKIKKQEKTLRQYNNIKTGSKMRLILENGLFDIP
ncbi:MAG: hypothetical protein K2O47_00065, partial [Muribaculaceae bacterium]|nr:hypothetical protein [Muribaculaceae bacterium]